MKISINMYTDDRVLGGLVCGVKVAKGWWGLYRIHYVADSEVWGLWVTGGEKPNVKKYLPNYQGYTSGQQDLSDENTLDNIAKSMRYHGVN